MWQRFQTFLFLICACLLLSMFWSDMCYVMEPVFGGQEGELQRYSIKFVNRSQFLIFTFITFALNVISILYYKARILQIRLCIMNILILLGYQIWILVYYFQFKSVYTFTLPTIFPFVCIILLLIAMKYIWRDEAEVIAYVMSHKKSKKK
ncbi:MAG: DUF4293 domain-containing protein [Bacteroidales bacterium]|nr:DUF4293 domain-containing protein [Bacteroidales bacterium]